LQKITPPGKSSTNTDFSNLHVGAPTAGVFPTTGRYVEELTTQEMAAVNARVDAANKRVDDVEAAKTAAIEAAATELQIAAEMAAEIDDMAVVKRMTIAMDSEVAASLANDVEDIEMLADGAPTDGTENFPAVTLDAEDRVATPPTGNTNGVPSDSGGVAAFFAGLEPPTPVKMAASGDEGARVPDTGVASAYVAGGSDETLTFPDAAAEQPPAAAEVAAMTPLSASGHDDATKEAAKDTKEDMPMNASNTSPGTINLQQKKGKDPGSTPLETPSADEQGVPATTPAKTEEKANLDALERASTSAVAETATARQSASAAATAAATAAADDGLWGATPRLSKPSQ
jgi:hypothetical protein